MTETRTSAAAVASSSVVTVTRCRRDRASITSPASSALGEQRVRACVRAGDMKGRDVSTFTHTFKNLKAYFIN